MVGMTGNPRRVGGHAAVFGLAMASVSCGFDRAAAPALDLVIETESLPSAMVAEPYAEAINASGGVGGYAWEVTAGALPPGLALEVDDLGGGDALITGVPEAEGTFTFTVAVRSEDHQEATRELAIQVLPEPSAVAIRTTAVPPALAGAPYSVRLQVNGATDQDEWRLVDGRLPTGLTLSSDGRIQGSPAEPDTAGFTVEVARDGAVDRRDFVLAVVPHRLDRFQVTLFPVREVPAAVQPHLDAAVAEWEAAITGNLAPVTIGETFFPAGSCGGFGPSANGTTVDDVLIILNIAPIDGPGGVLGRAGPCAIRGLDDLPIVGIMTLDSDDLLPLAGSETLTFIIAHEIAHVLGFGALWNHFDLLAGAGTDDPRFTGPDAVAEYRELGGTGNVPVENEGGAGTADAHWRQRQFRNERMTGFSAPPGVPQPLSRVSIASMADMGYTVDLSAADSFALAAALAPHAHADGHPWGDLGHDEVYMEPVRVIYPDGTTRTVPLR